MGHLVVLVLLSCAVWTSSAQHCSEKLDLVFIIDSSGSITFHDADGWQLIKDFLTDLMRLFQIGNDFVKIGAVVFSNNASMAFPLLGNETEIQANIAALENQGERTNISGALRIMTEMYTADNHDAIFHTRPDARDVCLLITDGHSNEDSHRTIHDATFAHRHDIELYVVGVTTEVNVEEIRLMSSPPQVENQTYWLLPNFRSLAAVLEMIETRLCTGLLPTSVTPNPIPEAVNEDQSSSQPTVPTSTRATDSPSTRQSTTVPSSTEMAGTELREGEVITETSFDVDFSTTNNTVGTLFVHNQIASNANVGTNQEFGHPSSASTQSNDLLTERATLARMTSEAHDLLSTNTSFLLHSSSQSFLTLTFLGTGGGGGGGGGGERGGNGVSTTQPTLVPSTSGISQNATPFFLDDRAEPTAQALVENDGFIAGMSVLGVFLFCLLMFLLILICCCCCCRTKCCACCCGACAEKAYCADNCACCTTPVWCCSLGAILCCPCGASLLAWLCCCCCWTDKEKSKSCVSVAPSDERVIVHGSDDGHIADWRNTHIVPIPPSKGKTKGDLFITSHTQTSPRPGTKVIQGTAELSSDSSSDAGSVNFTLIMDGERGDTSVCYDCHRRLCICSTKNGETREAEVQTPIPERPGKESKKKNKYESTRQLVPIGPKGPIGSHTTVRHFRTPPASEILPVTYHRTPHHTLHHTRPITTLGYTGSTCCYDPNCYAGRDMTRCDFIGDCEVVTGCGSCAPHSCYYDVHRSACRQDYASCNGSYHGSCHGSIHNGFQGTSHVPCHACNRNNYDGHSYCSYGHNTHNTCHQCGVHQPTRVTTLPIDATRTHRFGSIDNYHRSYQQTAQLNLTEIHDAGNARETRRRKDKKRHERRADRYRYDTEGYTTDNLPPLHPTQD